jgi:hypothetical protein
MRRGMWFTAWHDRSVVAPSALTQRCDAAARPSFSPGPPRRVGVFPRLGGLFPCNGVNCEAALLAVA